VAAQDKGPLEVPRDMAPGAMTLKRAQLLLLALGLGLASAQKTLQEVPVQPGFDAYKVGVLARHPDLALR
jgi:hypothetical protein